MDLMHFDNEGALKKSEAGFHRTWRAFESSETENTKIKSVLQQTAAAYGMRGKGQSVGGIRNAPGEKM